MKRDKIKYIQEVLTKLEPLKKYLKSIERALFLFYQMTAFIRSVRVVKICSKILLI